MASRLANKVLSSPESDADSSSLFNSLGLTGQALQNHFDEPATSANASPVRPIPTHQSVERLLFNIVSAINSVARAIKEQTGLLASAITSERHFKEEDKVVKDAVPHKVSKNEKYGSVHEMIVDLVPQVLGVLTAFLPEIIAMVGAAYLANKYDVPTKLSTFEKTGHEQIVKNVYQPTEQVAKKAGKELHEELNNSKVKKHLKDVEDTISEFTTSIASGARELIKHFEGFIRKARWDVNHYRAGYGSDTYVKDGKVHSVEKGTIVDRSEADADLDRRIVGFQNTIKRQIGNSRWGAMNDDEKSALTSYAYNYGSLSKDVVRAVKTGDKHEIAKAIRHHAEDNKGVNRKRRLLEAEIIEHSTSKPTIQKHKPEASKSESLKKSHKASQQTTNVSNQNIVVAPGQMAHKTETALVRPPSPTAPWGEDYQTYFGTVA